MQDPDFTDAKMNEFRFPNTTNLHTHGLHISGKVKFVYLNYEKLNKTICKLWLKKLNLTNIPYYTKCLRLCSTLKFIKQNITVTMLT